MDETQTATDETVAASDQSTDEQQLDQTQEQNQPEVQEQQNEDTDTDSTDQAQSTEEAEADSEAEKPEQDSTRREKRQARYIEKLSKQLEAARSSTHQTKLNNGRDSYQPIEYGEQEYNIADLQNDRSQYGQKQYQEGLEQAESIAQATVWKNQVEKDNEYVDRKYPILDEGSEDFDPDIANLLNNQFLQITGFNGKTVNNPISYRDFVRANMELAESLVTDRNATSAKNIAKQASQTSVKTASNNRHVTRDWSDPNKIGALTPDEYDKYKPEIEAYMKAHVGPIYNR